MFKYIGHEYKETNYQLTLYEISGEEWGEVGCLLRKFKDEELLLCSSPLLCFYVAQKCTKSRLLFPYYWHYCTAQILRASFGCHRTDNAMKLQNNSIQATQVAVRVLPRNIVFFCLYFDQKHFFL